MINIFFLLLYMVPVGILGWRVVVTKSRKKWLRVGAAAAATVSLVGSVVVFDRLTDFGFKDWRNDIALLASATGSIYLLLWSQRNRGNRRHRTISIIAAIVGLVPVVGTIITTMLFGSSV